MVTMQEKTMGRFSVEVELANLEDLMRAERGELSPAQVRRVQIGGVVDSGATRVVIPEAVAQQLGLKISGTTGVRYADGRTAQRSVAPFVRLGLGGRDGVYSAIVEPGRESVLIGAIVLEDLDFLIDCKNQCIVPRDPDMIISEVE